MIGGLRLGVVLQDQRLGVAAVAGGRVRDVFTLDAQENPAEVLRAELRARRLKVRKAWVALQRSLTTVKALELPLVAGGNLPQMVAFELERHLPFPAEDAAFDFLPLPSAPGAPQHVLLVGCERRTVDRVLRLLEDARLAPQALTVACHDLVGLVALPRRGKQVVWVHVVGEEAELLFVRGPRLRLSRSVPANDEAALATEIGKSLRHLGWEECHEIWVSGDGSPQLLASSELSSLGCPVSPPPLSSRARAAVARLGDAANGLTLLALATAMAPRLRTLNLLPPALRPRQLTRGQLVTAATFATAAALGLALLFAQGYQSHRYRTRVDADIRRLDPEVKAVEGIIADLDRNRKLLATLRTVEEDSLRPLPVLQELTELTPSDAWFTTVSFDAKGIEISGQATAANQLIPLLEGSSRLEKVEFASPVTKGRDKEQFRIRAEWEHPPKPSAPAPPTAPAAARPRGARSP